MKLIGFEFYKLFSKKLFILSLVLFFAANLMILVYSQSNDLEVKTVHNNLSDYESVISKYSDCESFEAQRQLESELKTVEIALQIDRTADKSTGDDVEILERLTEQYKAENPKEFKEAQSLDFTRKELLDRQTFLSELVNQIKYISSYSSFIGEMQQRAQRQLKFSIFAEKGSFSYNNIQKTPSDFENLNGIQLEIGNNYAVENSTTFVLTDLLAFALVFLMCIYIFTFERDKELYGLIRATGKGRLPLISSKITVLIIMTFFISAVYYLSDISVCGLYCGFGDMTRNIQSIEMFMNCNLNLQIWQYLLLWCVSKIVTMCVIALLLALVFVLIKNTSVIFIATAAAVLAEGVMYAAIGANAPFNQFKYVNLFYLLGGNNVFGNYLNINFFSQPVNITAVYLIAMPLSFVLSVSLICFAFVRQAQTSGRNILAPVTEKVRTKFSSIRGSVSVFSGECFKHYKGSMAFVVIILLAFIAYGSFTEDISIVYSSASESAYCNYLDVLEGGLTPEKEAFLQEQQSYFDSLYEQQDIISADESLSEEEKEMKLSAIKSILETKGTAFEEVSLQAEYIKEVGEKYNITPVFVNNIIYKRLVENPVREWQYFILLMLSVIFISSNVFAYEHKKQMVNLIRCTQKGKTKLVLSKISAILLTTVISYILIYLPYYINFIRTFGSASFDSPIIFVQDFSGVNSTISINSMIFITAAVHIVFAVTVMMFVAMLSQILKNNILSMIVATVAILFPCLLCMNLTEIRLYTAFQNGNWLLLVPCLIIICIFVLLICLTVITVSFSNIEFKASRRRK